MAEKRPRLAIEDASDEEPQVKGTPNGEEGDLSPEVRTGQGPNEETSARELRSSLRRMARGHERAVVGGLAGLCVAVLVFALGLWRALFVALCVAVGVVVGQSLDGDTRALDAIKRVLRGNQS